MSCQGQQKKPVSLSGTVPHFRDPDFKPCAFSGQPVLAYGNTRDGEDLPDQEEPKAGILTFSPEKDIIFEPICKDVLHSREVG